MNRNLALLIHGPLCVDNLSTINKELSVFSYLFDIVIVAYAKEYDDYAREIKKYYFFRKAILIKIKDILNPGFFNINRQIISVKAGLESISSKNIVIKLRSDQSINFNKMFSYIQNYDYCENNKIITTNCYTRRDRLYHPSDMLLCAKRDVLYNYYSCPLMSSTHLEHEISEVLKINKYTEHKGLIITPESYLFRNYLSLLKHSIQETQKDSIEQLKKHFYLINSWNINYRSAKQRNDSKGKDIILPYYFRLSPFKNYPVENTHCYASHELDEILPSFTDVFYIMLSKYRSYSIEKVIRIPEESFLYKSILHKIKNIFPKSNIEYNFKYITVSILIFLLLGFPYFSVRFMIKRLKKKKKYLKYKLFKS